MGFTTIPDALRAAGKSAADAMGELHGVDCASPVARVAGAMPGGNAAVAATHFRDSLATTFTEWCAEGERHAGGLTQAADLYARGDQNVAGVFLQAGPTMRGPR